MATSLIFILILSVYITGQYVSAQAVEPLILYGDTVKIEDYPYYAGLNNCGAAILSDIWIMTAAHCIVGVKQFVPKLWKARSGFYHADEAQAGGGWLNTLELILQGFSVSYVVSPLKKNYVWVGGETFANSIRVPYKYIYQHEGYPDPTGLPINDIALLKLSSPLRFSKKIQPIKLPSGPTSNTNITFVGRGYDETGRISKTLKKVDLIKLSTMECIKLIPFGYYDLIQSNMEKFETSNICARREGYKPNICSGDSGSPLTSGDTVVGLASFTGKLPCKKVKLSFFVNVASYVPWIKSITGL